MHFLSQYIYPAEEEEYHASLASMGGSQGRNGNGRSTSRIRSRYGAISDLEDQRRHPQDVGSDDEPGDSDDDALGDEVSGKSADTFEEQFRWLEEEVATLVADVHDLALYSKLNFTGFIKILKVRLTFGLHF